MVEGYDKFAAALDWRPIAADNLAADNLYIWLRIEQGWYAQQNAHEKASSSRLDMRVRIEAKSSAVIMLHATFERAVKLWIGSWKDDPLMPLPQEPSAYRVAKWEEIDETMRRLRGIGFADLEVAKQLEKFRLEANQSRHADGDQQRKEYGHLGGGSIQSGLFAVRRFWSSVLRTYQTIPSGDRSQG